MWLVYIELALICEDHDDRIADATAIFDLPQPVGHRIQWRFIRDVAHHDERMLLSVQLPDRAIAVAEASSIILNHGKARLRQIKYAGTVILTYKDYSDAFIITSSQTAFESLLVYKIIVSLHV